MKILLSIIVAPFKLVIRYNEWCETVKRTMKKDKACYVIYNIAMAFIITFYWLGVQEHLPGMLNNIWEGAKKIFRRIDRFFWSKARKEAAFKAAKYDGLMNFAYQNNDII